MIRRPFHSAAAALAHCDFIAAVFANIDDAFIENKVLTFDALQMPADNGIGIK